jgi:hypothetical protein
MDGLFSTPGMKEKCSIQNFGQKTARAETTWGTNSMLENIIKMNLGKMLCEHVEWIQMTHRIQWETSILVCYKIGLLSEK